MIQLSFINAELIFTLIWFLIRIIVWLKQRKINFKNELLQLLMFINLAIIIRFTLFPRNLVDGHVQDVILDIDNIFPLRINLVPFVHMFRYNYTINKIWNFMGNILMLLPTGILLPIVYKKLNSFWKVTLIGFLISLCVELIQLPFASRASDIDDVILNTLGVIIGYTIYRIIKQTKSS